jgi:Platelet-activating factor acetylhydrolase, isoform II
LRRFEFLLAFACVFGVVWSAVFGVRTRRGIVALGLLALFVIHWRVEGLRWQMVPLYATALGLLIGDILTIDRDLDWTRRIARGVFGVAGLAVASILPLVLPVPRLPAPSGPETIGTVTIQLTDTERAELYGPSPGGPRKLMVQVWYPATPEPDVEPIPWSEDWDVVAPAVSRQMGLPDFFLDHTRYVESHAYPSLPAAPGSFPLIIYSHGWTGFRTIAVNQIESLVSNGFMVVAPDHTYGAVATRFENGEVAELDPDALPDVGDVSDEAYDEASQELVGVFAGDVESILDAFDLGTDGPFGALAASADTSRIGIYGHSTGGGAAVSVCLQDERCDAVLGLDPWVEPIPDRVVSITPSKPALYMRSDEWRGNENDAILRGLAERSTATTYWVGVDGAHHNDFVLTPLLSPLSGQFGLTGSIPAERVIPIIDRYLVGFFDVYLLDTGPAAIETPSFDEVSLEVIRPEE